MAQMVREFSAVGPCIVLGEFTGRTKTNRIKFIDRYTGKATFRAGFSCESGLVHVFPCPSCRDHSQSQYPNGYEN